MNRQALAVSFLLLALNFAPLFVMGKASASAKYGNYKQKSLDEGSVSSANQEADPTQKTAAHTEMTTEETLDGIYIMALISVILISILFCCVLVGCCVVWARGGTSAFGFGRRRSGGH